MRPQRAAATAAGAANTVLLKPNQRCTLTETVAAWDAAREVGFRGIVSARSGETEDTSIVDIAVGWAAGQLKVGSFTRSERMAKWNAALRIEEALGHRARFRGRTALAGASSVNVVGAACVPAQRDRTFSVVADQDAILFRSDRLLLSTLEEALQDTVLPC